MKNLIAAVSIFFIAANSHSLRAQAVQDFTHGVFVDNTAFATNPGNWSGKIVELRDIPFTGLKPTPAPVKNRVATANSSSSISNSPAPKTGNPNSPTPEGPGGGTSSSTIPICPTVTGYNSLPFAITPTFRPCLLMTNAVKKQLPTKSSKLILYVYCKNDGTLELKRVKRIN